jgi:hypothetical protein
MASHPGPEQAFRDGVAPGQGTGPTMDGSGPRCVDEFRACCGHSGISALEGACCRPGPLTRRTVTEARKSPIQRGPNGASILSEPD